jgi:hypothetical protein
VRVSITSPRVRPSPNDRRVGIRIRTFEACSGFTHVTAHRIAQSPQGDLCHEAPALPVTRPSRSSATRLIDNSLGGFLLHWRFAPSGRTVIFDVSRRSVVSPVYSPTPDVFDVAANRRSGDKRHHVLHRKSSRQRPGLCHSGTGFLARHLHVDAGPCTQIRNWRPSTRLPRRRASFRRRASAMPHVPCPSEGIASPEGNLVDARSLVCDIEKPA